MGGDPVEHVGIDQLDVRADSVVLAAADDRSDAAVHGGVGALDVGTDAAEFAHAVTPSSAAYSFACRSVANCSPSGCS